MSTPPGWALRPRIVALALALEPTEQTAHHLASDGRLRAAFGFVEILQIIDHETGQGDDDVAEEGE
jgi:hypothetical protein